MAPWVNFINLFMRSFYARRPQKRKKLLELTVFFALLRSLHVKAVRKMLVKVTTIAVAVKYSFLRKQKVMKKGLFGKTIASPWRFRAVNQSTRIPRCMMPFYIQLCNYKAFLFWKYPRNQWFSTFGTWRSTIQNKTQLLATHIVLKYCVQVHA